MKLVRKWRKITGTFYEKELQKKRNQEEFRIGKVIKRKGNKLYMSNGRSIPILLILGLIKMIL